MPRRPSKIKVAKKNDASVKSKSSKTTKNEKSTKTTKSDKTTKSTKSVKTTKRTASIKTIKSTRPKIRKSVRKTTATTNSGMGIGGISTAARQIVRALKNPDEVKNIRFYDDSEENIDDVEKDYNIECIHVPRTNTSPKGKSQGGDEHEYIRYIRDHGKWDLDNKDSDLYDVLTFYHESPHMQEDEISEALTDKHIDDLMRWTRKNPNAKCVIFDFDRVINRVEGVIGYDTVAEIRKYNLKPSGLAKYHIGSKSRMRKIKKMFDELVRRGIDVRIVTNNTAAGCELFTEILKCIHPVLNKNTIHGSFNHDTKLHCIREFILM